MRSCIIAKASASCENTPPIELYTLRPDRIRIKGSQTAIPKAYDYMIGGQVGIIGHLKIGDNVKIQAQAGVTSDIKSDSRVTGTPAISHMNYNKSYIHFKNLPEIVKKIDKKE